MDEPAHARDRPSSLDASNNEASAAASPTEVSPSRAGPPVRVIELASWLLCPAAFVACCWTLLLAPEAFLRWLPRPKYAWLLAGPNSRADDASVLLALSKHPHRWHPAASGSCSTQHACPGNKTKRRHS